MARAKRKSDEIYNVRRRAQRAINGLEKQKKQSKSAVERRAITKYVNSVKKQIDRTYRGSGFNQQKAVDVLKSVTGRGMSGKNRANKIFKQQLGLASNRKNSSLGKYGSQKVRIFYASTQRIWQGLPPEKRNQAIMSHFGTDSLSEAFDKVMKNNKEAVEAVKGMSKNIGITDENAEFYENNDVESDDITSPDYLNLVNYMR